MTLFNCIVTNKLILIPHKLQMREVSLWFINDGRGILTNPTKCFRIKPPVIAGPEKEGLFSGACEGPSSGVHFLTLDVCMRQKLLKEGAGGWGDKDQKWPPVAWGVCIGWPCIPVCLEQTRSYLLLWLSCTLESPDLEDELYGHPRVCLRTKEELKYLGTEWEDA